jgi:hypothetical protein
VLPVVIVSLFPIGFTELIFVPRVQYDVTQILIHSILSLEMCFIFSTMETIFIISTIKVLKQFWLLLPLHSRMVYGASWTSTFHTF